MTFNEKIDKYMKDNKIDNIKQLASLADIPYTTLRDFYEKQSADNSRLSTIRKLSKYMGCSMDYLAYDDIEDFNYNNINENNKIFSEVELLFDKAKPHLSPDDKETIKFIMNKTIKNYEENKNNNKYN